MIFPKMKNTESETAEAKQQSWIKSYRDWVVSSEKVSLHDWLFNSPINDTTSRRWLPIYNTLVLTGFNIYKGLRIDDPQKLKEKDFVFVARGRDLRGAIFAFANLPKVDFTAAQLQAAIFDGAKLHDSSFACPSRSKDKLTGDTPSPDLCTQLQGASFLGGELKGVSLRGAQLQDATLDLGDLRDTSLEGANLERASFYGTLLDGASLDRAQLQAAQLPFTSLRGASLYEAQLQGAYVDGALQGASLDGAQLQGASLGADFQGASLHSANLQGVSLENAQLQGASLTGAQLQGATLQAAVVDATDLSGAFLWRTNISEPNLPQPKAIRLSSPPDWRPPQPLDDKTYRDLTENIKRLSSGYEGSLDTINRLDCSSSNKTLASCDPSLSPPPEAVEWRSALENAARIDESDYASALAASLKTLVCSDGEEATYILRGRGFQSRLKDAGDEGRKLIGDITNKDNRDCPVSALLTDADRATLLRIKREIEPKSPAPESPAYSP